MVLIELLSKPDTYDLGLDLMWASGADYDETMRGVWQQYNGLTLEEKCKWRLHMNTVEIDYLQWAGAIHPEPIVATAHRIKALEIVSYNCIDYQQVMTD